MSGVVVVDTSIAVKWVHNEPDSPVAAALLDEWIATGIEPIAPSLLASEIANAPFKAVRGGDVGVPAAKLALSQVLLSGLRLDFSDDPAINLALSARALELAQTLGLPATYDAHYLALAEREGCEYWTADERLWNVAHPRFGWVRLLRQFAPPATP